MEEKQLLFKFAQKTKQFLKNVPTPSFNME